MSFAERLRATRLLATKLAASELSELAGFSSAHVGHIESGRTKNASLASAAGIAAVLGVSVEYLFSGIGREPTAAQVNAAVSRARAKRDGKPVPALADAALDEQTPAESVAAKRNSSRPSGPSNAAAPVAMPPQAAVPELVDATEDDSTTVRTEPLPAESTPKNLPPVTTEGRSKREREATDPQDPADIENPTPLHVQAHPELGGTHVEYTDEELAERATRETPSGAL